MTPGAGPILTLNSKMLNQTCAISKKIKIYYFKWFNKLTEGLHFHKSILPYMWLDHFCVHCASTKAIKISVKPSKQWPAVTHYPGTVVELFNSRDESETSLSASLLIYT